MARMTGARALVEMLRAEGVKYVFGNPGTTELPFLDALQDAKDVQYINPTTGESLRASVDSIKLSSAGVSLILDGQPVPLAFVQEIFEPTAE